jgi:hypothetical protein
MAFIDEKGLTRIWGYVIKRFNEIPQADLEQTNRDAKDYIKNKPTSEDVLRIFVEMDALHPVSGANNVLYTDSDGKILIL